MSNCTRSVLARELIFLAKTERVQLDTNVTCVIDPVTSTCTYLNLRTRYLCPFDATWANIVNGHKLSSSSVVLCQDCRTTSELTENALAYKNSRYFDVTNPATMTSLPRYYDVTNLATMTSLTSLL